MFFRQIHKGGKEIWMFILTIILVIGGYIIGQIPLTLAVAYYASSAGNGEDALTEVIETLNFSSLGMSENMVFSLMLLMFVVAMVALYVGVVKIHKRPFFSIWTGRRTVDWNRVFFGFSVWLLLALVFEVVAYFIDPGNYLYSFDMASFIPLLVIVVVLLPIQTTFEELFIRGYLMQTTGLVFSPRWVALLLTSLLFGIMHMMNPEVSEFGASTMMIYYVGIAIFLGLITLLDDGLEVAIGIHAATNLFGALILNFEESAIRTPSVFKLASVDAEYMTIFSFAAAAIFIALYRSVYGPLNWLKVFGSVRQDFDPDYLEELKTEKMKMISSSLSNAKRIEPWSMDGLEEDVAFFKVDDLGYLFITENASPFKFGGHVQKPFQLGYYELIMARRGQVESDIEEDRNPEYLTRYGRDLRLLKAIARESRYRTFLSHKAYKMALEDGQMIYFIMQPFPSIDTHLIDGWRIGSQLVVEISVRQFELARTQGGVVLIQELRQLPDFPFIANPESAL